MVAAPTWGLVYIAVQKALLVTNTRIEAHIARYRMAYRNADIHNVSRTVVLVCDTYAKLRRSIPYKPMV